MKRMIDGQWREFMPIREFRAIHGLPESFGVAYFEPKDYTGLGSIESPEAGAALNTVRNDVLAVLPLTRGKMAATEWLRIVPGLAKLFETKLHEINGVISLRDPEIGFAVSGFADVCNAVAYALIRARLGNPPPDFYQIYTDWLNNSIRVSQTLHPYDHEGKTWHIQLVTDAYGRAGMSVRMAGETKPDEVIYVTDNTLACPAEGFMARLLADIAARMISVTPG